MTANHPMRRLTHVPELRVAIDRRDDAPLAIEGYAAVFYDGTPATEYRLWDDVVERIMPGAFDRAIREDDCRALFNHDPDHLIGRKSAGTLTLSVDTRGLRYRITPPDTPIVQQLTQNLERKEITGSSFSFLTRKRSFQEIKTDAKTLHVIELLDVELWDVGPVTFPAYSATEAALARDAAQPSLRAAAADVEAVRADLDAWRTARAAALADEIRLRAAAAKAFA